MATSPIYNWPEPDNTDLVKNGALAMRTLGDAIDTTMGTMVAKTIVDAKGDLIAGTAADTAARLAVGNNGETLVADSSTSTGLRYQVASSANAVINGGMDIWQKGTTPPVSTTSNNVSTADRWCARRYADLGGITVSQVASGLDGFRYAARIQRTSGNTDTNGFYFFQSLETQESLRFAGKTVTFSFYLRKGSNLSAAPVVYLSTGTGTDQNYLTGFTGSTPLVNAGALSPAPSTSWVRYSYTVNVASSATQIGFQTYWVPSGTASTNDYYDVTGFQLEEGSVATTYRRAGGTLQGETDACQRYLPAVLVSTGDVGTGQAYSTTAALVTIPFPTTARVAPTGVTVNAAGNFRLRNSTAGLVSPTAIVFGTSTPNSGTVEITGASGLSAGNATSLVNFTSGTILFTGCEL